MNKAVENLNLKCNLKIFTFFTFATITLFVAILLMPQNIDAKEISEFNRDLRNYNAKLKVFDANNHEIHEFSIAIADSDQKRMYGLMNLDHLPENNGMIFLFSQSQIITMWMKNTRIPLDMIFIDKNNLIANIKTNSKPYSLDIISSQVEINQVLEINAGLSDKLGIKIGQKIIILK